jgi:hypothetical protein
MKADGSRGNMSEWIVGFSQEPKMDGLLNGIRWGVYLAASSA